MAIPLSSNARNMVAPSCAGDLEMYTPALSSASNFAVGFKMQYVRYYGR